MDNDFYRYHISISMATISNNMNVAHNQTNMNYINLIDKERARLAKQTKSLSMPK